MNTYLAKKITLALLLASPIYSLSISDIAYAENTGGILEQTGKHYSYTGENNPANSEMYIDNLDLTNGSDKGYCEIYGGMSEDEDIIVENNKVNVNIDSIGDLEDRLYYSIKTYGGYSNKGDVKNNTITINGGTFNEQIMIMGGRSDTGIAEGNAVIINGGTFNEQTTVTGGITSKSDTGIAENNAVIINGATFNNNSKIVAVESHGIGQNNKLEINESTVINGGYIYGVNGAYDIVEANNNEVKIIGTENNKIQLNNVKNISGVVSQNSTNLKNITGNVITMKDIDINSEDDMYIAVVNMNTNNYDDEGNRIISNNTLNMEKVFVNGERSIKIYGIEHKNCTIPDSQIFSDNNVVLSDSIIESNSISINGVYLSSRYNSAKARDNTGQNNKLEINSSTILTNNDINITGAYVKNGNIIDNSTIIKNSTVQTLNGSINIYGTNSNDGAVNINNNEIIISDSDIKIGNTSNEDINIYAVFRNQPFDMDMEGNKAEVRNNRIILQGNSDVEFANLWGYKQIIIPPNIDNNFYEENNKLILDNWAGKVKSVNNFTDIEFKNIKDEADVILNPTQTLDLADMTVSVSTEGLDLSENSQHTLIQNMKNTDLATMDIKDGETVEETDNGVRVHELSHEISDTKDKLLLNVGKSVLAGNYTDASGKSYGNSVLNIDEGFHTNAGVVAGSYGTGSAAAQNGRVVISGDFAGKTDTVYGGYSENGSVSNNSIELQSAASAENLNLFGANKKGTNNTLEVNNWQGDVKNIGNFNAVNFANVNWQPNNEKGIINITGDEATDLSGTKVNVKQVSLSGGQNINAGQSMKLISGRQINNFAEGTVNTTAGVVTDIEGKVALDGGKDVTMTVTSVGANKQTNLVAENRAVAAAFLNQGGDLVSDGLNSLTDQYGYGMKTFAAVYGNRSTYDVNSDLKINGWSEIIGIGEKKRFSNSDFAYGVFYENGRGNYRTYNEFNNEFFRGDGDLVYNGGGIAARLNKDNGMYYEGSLRAGTLKSEMSNALKDSSGNSYGYENDSTYYGAHVGVGRVLKLDENRDLDIYGKFFHTYIDGDDMEIAGDRFSFDSVTSDRLRIGAQLTTNKNNKWSTHYGLAYEYEFNGDSDMKAGQFDMPTQSLEGGTVIGEIGLTYQGSELSPWSLDLNLRGYEGQREGFSGHVQATYSF